MLWEVDLETECGDKDLKGMKGILALFVWAPREFEDL